MFEIDSI